jgi:hypothetical protein
LYHRLLPPDTKPLFNSIAAIKETIASIHLQPITFPKVLPLTVPPVIADGFNRSALTGRRNGAGYEIVS